MVLKLDVCTDADMDRTFTIISSAFGHEHPYLDACFPDHEEPIGRKRSGERMLAMKRSDPNTTFLKVLNTDTGKMIAQAKWNVYDGVVPEEADLEGGFWQGQAEKEYAQFLFREYLVPRRKAIKESRGRLVSLDILTVDPGCQRRGAGRMLVKWGTAIADEMGVETVVEASDYARHLYESEGFKFSYHYVIDLPEKWAGREKQSFIWMVRPAKKDEKA